MPDPDHSEAVAHLRGADPVMAAIIERVGPCMLGASTDRGGPAHDHYGALVRAIVGQQLSVSAARSIYGRLTDRYGGRTPKPARLLADDPDELRAAAGLSRFGTWRSGSRPARSSWATSRTSRTRRWRRASSR